VNYSRKQLLPSAELQLWLLTVFDKVKATIQSKNEVILDIPASGQL
jgi:hypothetical protein